MLTSCLQPGGHLFLSTIARTPLSYLLTILIAERALRLVTPGTHSHDKFINPSEFLDFFKNDLKWISHLYDGLPTRSEAEIRGMGVSALEIRMGVYSKRIPRCIGLQLHFLGPQALGGSVLTSDGWLPIR